MENLKIQRKKEKGKLILNNIGPKSFQNLFTFREKVINHDLHGQLCYQRLFARTKNRQRLMFDGGLTWN